MTTRYWSDELYQQFYSSSAPEQHLVKVSCRQTSSNRGEASRNAGAAPSLASYGAAGAVSGGSSSSSLTSSRRKPAANKADVDLEKFQQAFAEWSEGRGSIGFASFRRFLAQVGVELTTTQSRCLWDETLGEDASRRMTYHEALHAYQDVLATPVEFRHGVGSAPPGELNPREAEDPDCGKVLFGNRPAVPTKLLEKEAQRLGKRPPPAAPTKSVPAAAQLEVEMQAGFSLPFAEAESFLCDEGLDQQSVGAFLDQFRAVGSVPQAVLFDYVSNWAGADGLASNCPAEPTAQIVIA